MVKTVKEFRDELKTLRKEMSEKGEFADTRLIASWLDRLVISLEELTPTLGLANEELSQLAEAGECPCCVEMKKKPAKKKAAKKASKKKVAKKKAMKKKPMKKAAKKRKR